MAENERARLMPEGEVRKRWVRARRRAGVRQAVDELSQHFWVARRVVEKRLIDLGLLAPEDASYKG